MTSINVKFQNDSIGEKMNCRLEVLTPVHIGSGFRLKKGFDFVSNSGRTRIMSTSKFEEYFRENPDELSRFDDPKFRIENVIQKIESLKEYQTECDSREILEFEKNGAGCPYLPGSSIKGAFRTALLSQLILELNGNERSSILRPESVKNPKFASEPLLRRLFGNDPNNNLMRVIQVYDSSIDDDHLNLYRVLILNLTDSEGKTIAWKDVPNKTNHDDPKKGTPIYAEMIAPSATSTFSLRFDIFLLKRIPEFQRKFKIEQLPKIINDHSRKLLEKEIDFLETSGSKQLEGVINHSKDLLKLIPNQNSDQYGKECILRLGWGTGWKNMTGDYLTENELKEFRMLPSLKLGKSSFPRFPKTRKIVFENDESAYLPGYVKIVFRAEKEHTKLSKTKPSVKIPESTEKDPMELLREKFRVTKKS